MADEKKAEILDIDDQSGNIEGLTLKDGFFQRIFKILQGVNREQFVRAAMKRFA